MDKMTTGRLLRIRPCLCRFGVKTGYGSSPTSVRLAAYPDIGFRICEGRALAFLARVIELPIVQYHLPLPRELRVAVDEQRLRLTRVAGIFRYRAGSVRCHGPNQGRFDAAVLVRMNLQRVAQPAGGVGEVDVVAKALGEGSKDPAAEAGALRRQYRRAAAFLPDDTTSNRAAR
jgi:hypothetical protein